MQNLIKKTIESSDRIFFLMKDIATRRYRLFEIVSSDRKFSAQLVEVKQPEREALLARMQIGPK